MTTFKDDFTPQSKMVAGFEMQPFFEACDGCGEPFTRVEFGGRGNLDHYHYELCVGCTARMASPQPTPDLVERVMRSVQLRYLTPQGNA
jgi:hypothetical protein